VAVETRKSFSPNIKRIKEGKKKVEKHLKTTIVIRAGSETVWRRGDEQQRYESLGYRRRRVPKTWEHSQLAAWNEREKKNWGEFLERKHIHERINTEKETGEKEGTCAILFENKTGNRRTHRSNRRKRKGRSVKRTRGRKEVDAEKRKASTPGASSRNRTGFVTKKANLSASRLEKRGYQESGQKVEKGRKLCWRAVQKSKEDLNSQKEGDQAK